MNKTNSNLEFRKIKSLNYLYEINENGTIFRNVKSKKQLKIKLDMHHSQKGYYVTFVHIGGRRPDSYIKRVMIHRAVAECWLGDCPDGYEVDHIDRNSHNNDYRNLRYVTKSEQMKNRDHTNISKKGSENLRIARQQRSKPVALKNDDVYYEFESHAACARFLASQYGKSASSMNDRLCRERAHIFDYDVIYLNAETGHGSSTEQGTVHSYCDLTTDYRNFNEGKIAECLDRVKHSKYTDFTNVAGK